MLIDEIVKNTFKSASCCHGNGCGHNKNNPFLSLVVESTDHPPFLYSVAEAFKDYYYNPALFPSLNHAVSNRQQRSERREAVIVVMQSILEFLDLSSLRVGIPTKSGFQPLKLDVLRRRTNLGSRRFERAIQSLRQSGILKVSDQLKIRTASGGYHYFPAVRRLNKAFFVVLGFGERLAQEMKAATKRLAEKAKKLGSTLTQMAHFSLQTASQNYHKWRTAQQIQKAKRKRAAGTITQDEILSFLKLYYTPDEAERHMKNMHGRSLNPPVRPPGGYDGGM